MKSNITEEQAQSALDLTAEIIDEFGPRLTGTPACKKAGVRLKTELENPVRKHFQKNFNAAGMPFYILSAIFPFPI